MTMRRRLLWGPRRCFNGTAAVFDHIVFVLGPAFSHVIEMDAEPGLI